MRNAGGFAIAFLLILLGLLLAACGGQQAQAAAPASQQRAIQNKGSDTLVNLALAWAEAYREVAPDVSIAVTGGGTGTGIAALINGTVDIANASRAMKENEIEDARANGIDPQEFTVAIDALAVVVNQANPVDRLTIDQLADIFTGRVTNWQEVGGNNAPIILVSRETNSGTHVYFLEEVIRKGDSANTDVFAPQTLLMPSSVGITSEVQRNPNAIGYDGLGYTDPAHEKLIAVARDTPSPYVAPSVAAGADGSISDRACALHVHRGRAGGRHRRLSGVGARGRKARQIVAELGFVPLPSE
jgi:phosphate transport system substrate-binding protein